MEERNIINSNYEKLLQIELKKLAEIYRDQANNPAFTEITFDERLSLMIDEEKSSKLSQLVDGLKKRARLRLPNASLTEIQYTPDKELDKELILKLSDGDYINNHLNVCVIGATRTKKTFLLCALGNDACEKKKQVRYVRLANYLFDIDQAKKNDKYQTRQRYYTRPDFLLIDDWLLTPTTREQQEDILELVKRRSGEKSMRKKKAEMTL